MGNEANSQLPKVTLELTSCGSNPYMRKQVAVPFININDMWPKPKRQDMASPMEPGLRSLKRNVSLKVSAIGADKVDLPIDEGMMGVRISPENANAIVSPA